MNNKLIVVGNGSSLLDKKNGELIDSHEEVLRFNFFSTEKFEEYVGTKTTMWFTGTNFSEKNWRITLPYKKVFTFSWQWDENKCLAHQGYLQAIKQCPIEKVGKNNIIEIQKYVNDDKYFAYSSGSICIWRLLKDYDQITITGFDWWEKRDKHHYNDNHIIGTLHKPDLEKRFIFKLLEDNKIKFL